MANAQKTNFVFRPNGRVHLNRQGHQFSRLLAAELCASAVLMLYTPCSEVVCRVLATHSIRQFPLHFPSRASPCAITFQLESTCKSACMSLCSIICCGHLASNKPTAGCAWDGEDGTAIKSSVPNKVPARHCLHRHTHTHK